MSGPVVELLERRVGDCGCPEETYLFNGIDLTIHFEPTGEADGHMDGGDWGEAEKTVRADTPDLARAELMAWAASLTQAATPQLSTPAAANTLPDSPSTPAPPAR